MATASEWADVVGLSDKDLPAQLLKFRLSVKEYEDAEGVLSRLEALSNMWFVLWTMKHLDTSKSYCLHELADVVDEKSSDSDFNSYQVMSAYEEIIRANFSKFCTTERDAELSAGKHIRGGVPCSYRREGDYWIIYTTSGEILKGLAYRAPDLRLSISQG